MPIPRAEHLPTGRWRGVATIGARRRTQVFPTEGQALVWADTQMRRASQTSALPKPPAPVVVTLRDDAPIYLASRILEPGTISNYQSHLKPAIEEFGDVPLDGITHADVARWVADMGRRRGKGRVEPGTIAARLSCCGWSSRRRSAQKS